MPSLSRTGPANGSPVGGSPGVLVVDDDDTLRTILARELRKRGVRVWVATGGREAISLYADLAEEIDVILMDMHMPGMNGDEACAALRAGAPNVRCCFMTADLRPGTRKALLASGALEVFSKPFASLAALCDALRAHATPSGAAPGEAARWGS